eukprot:CAMPEP_0118928972 /NCGR_PEP_ID=MMETSP1169-20130426/6104_1 /TAXON_ID=36882 /ORGANISM="Pyramimonas obovata, Strain CCMP722" /LENGTH=2048 /DNA_ID=CAMNT_0006871077 /DNA_START=211 /DNA_END=6353 /DNA_ORIENTATION=+
MSRIVERDAASDKLPNLVVAEDKDYDDGLDRVLGDASRKSSDGLGSGSRNTSSRGGGRQNEEYRSPTVHTSHPVRLKSQIQESKRTSAPLLSHKPEGTISNGVYTIRVNKLAEDPTRPSTVSSSSRGGRRPGTVDRDANRRLPRVQQPFSASAYNSMLPAQSLPIYPAYNQSQSSRDPSPPRKVVHHIRPGKSSDASWALTETDNMEKEMVSTAVQVAPLPWNRFYFPGRDQKANKDSQNPFFEYIDVCIPPKFSAYDLPKRVVVEDAPEFVKKEWTKLYYLKDMHEFPPKHQWPNVNIYESREILRQDSQYWGEAHEEHTQILQLEDFCEFVCRLEPRSERDKEALQDLHIGLLMFLSKQIRTASETSAELYHAKEVRLKGQLEKKMLDLQERMNLEVKNLLDRAQVKEEARSKLNNSIALFKSALHKETTKKQDAMLMVSQKNAESLRAGVEKCREENVRLSETIKNSSENIANMRQEYEARIAKLEHELQDQSVTLEAVKVQWEHELSESIQLKEKVRQLEPRSKLGERAEEYFAKMVEAQQEVDHMRDAMRKRTAEIMARQSEGMEEIANMFDSAKRDLDSSASHLLKASFKQAEERMNFMAGQMAKSQALQAEQREQWELEREKAIALSEHVKQLQGQLQNQAACMEKERKQSVNRLAALKREMADAVMEATKAASNVDRGSYEADLASELQAEVMRLLEDKMATEEALVGRMEEMEMAKEENDRRTLVLKLEAKRRDIQYAAEMAALKCSNDEERAKLVEGLQASTDHIDLLVGSIERLNGEVQQVQMHTVTVQENEKLISQQLNNKMREMEATMDNLNQMHQKMDLGSIEEEPQLEKGTAHVTNAALTLSMAGQAADGLQRAMATRAHSVTAETPDTQPVMGPASSAASNREIINRLKKTVTELHMDLKVLRAKLQMASSTNQQQVAQLSNAQRLLMRGLSLQGEEPVRSAATKALEGLAEALTKSGEQRKGKGIGMFRRVAKMALKGIRMEAMAAAMSVKGGARKRAPQSNTHSGLPAKELMAARLKGVPLRIADASQVIAPLEPKEVAVILNVLPPEMAAEMLWLYTLHPEDIAEVVKLIHETVPMHAAATMKAMSEERRNQLLDVMDLALVTMLKAEACLAAQAPAFLSLGLHERSKMIEELEPMTALNVLESLASDADRKQTLAELPQALRDKLGSEAAMHSSASQVAMLLAAMPEKDQQQMLNVFLDTPERIASVLDNVTVPMAAELVTKLAADNESHKVNIFATMKQEKAEMVLAAYTMDHRKEGEELSRGVRDLWKEQGLSDLNSEDQFTRLARLTEEADEAQTLAVEKEAECEASRLWKESLVNKVAEFKAELETIQGKYQIELAEAAGELEDSKAKTGNSQGIKNAEANLAKVEARQKEHIASVEKEMETVSRELRRAIQAVLEVEEEGHALREVANEKGRLQAEAMEAAQAERDRQMDQLLKSNQEVLLEVNPKDVFGRFTMVVREMGNVNPPLRADEDLANMVADIDRHAEAVEAVTALKSAEKMFLLRAEAVPAMQKSLVEVQAVFKSSEDVPPPMQQFVAEADLALSRVLSVEDSTLVALQVGVVKLVAALHRVLGNQRSLHESMGIVKCKLAMKNARDESLGSAFMRGMLNPSVVASIRSQSALVDTCREVFAFLKNTYNIEAILAQLDFNPQNDEAEVDDPHSYDDNVFQVVVRHGDFEGLERYQKEEGTHLPQDPTSLEYRTANSSKQLYDGECSAFPMSLTKGSTAQTQLNTFGEVWGVLILHACEAESFKNAEADLNMLVRAVPMALMGILQQEDASFEKLQGKLSKYMLDRGGSYRNLSQQMLLESGEEAAKVQKEMTMEVKLDQVYFNTHRQKIEKILMTRKYVNKVLELKRYRQVSEVIVGVVSCVVMLVDAKDIQLRELLKDGLPTHPNAIQELWIFLRAKLCKIETSNFSRAKTPSKTAGAPQVRTSSVFLQMQKYRPTLDPVVESYVRDTMAKYTRSHIKKAAALMDCLTDWIICVTNSVGLIHVEEKIVLGEMVDNPFKSALSEKDRLMQRSTAKG